MPNLQFCYAAFQIKSLIPLIRGQIELPPSMPIFQALSLKLSDLVIKGIDNPFLKRAVMTKIKGK